MKKVFFFEGRGYVAQKMNDLYFDDIAVINGIVGYIDFVGMDSLAIVDEIGTSHLIKFEEVRTGYTLKSVWNNPCGGRTSIQELKINMA
ncbi:hypothetical protein [Parabacteroides sp. PF5-9]|uniref:hypothetical protein n=1 Tax=Parabacteroides sp. PF5-9 TaxID=1742404 RepID=UPI00247319A0|nr:hypothetical protein [Parabacteroides sp. PF5-9]MDH6356268.1 hypothetical protein [Parabacteroides sp. PF5-9]